MQGVDFRHNGFQPQLRPQAGRPGAQDESEESAPANEKVQPEAEITAKTGLD